MYICNRVLCRPLFWAGVAFFVSALIGSFWISFLLGGSGAAKDKCKRGCQDDGFSLHIG